MDIKFRFNLPEAYYLFVFLIENDFIIPPNVGLIKSFSLF